MATDKELLELAAKAAGYTLGRHTQKDWAFTYGGAEWNPLTDDGDALRLAVALRLLVEVAPLGSNVAAMLGATIIEDHGADPYAATRRAIVRAAAEIGRSMLSTDKTR